MATSISTSYHIVAFSALRLISVASPHIFNKITLQHAKVWLTKCRAKIAGLLQAFRIVNGPTSTSPKSKSDLKPKP